LAIAKLTLLSLRSRLARPSENTAKFTTGAPLTITAGTPAVCRTLNAEFELVAVSLAGSAAAAAIACPTGVVAGGGADEIAAATATGQGCQDQGRGPHPFHRRVHARLQYCFAAGSAAFWTATILFAIDGQDTRRHDPAGRDPLGCSGPHNLPGSNRLTWSVRRAVRRKDD
jgi:hypothetical protein